MLLRLLYYFLLFPTILAASFTIAGCNKGNSDDDNTDPYPFPILPEDNTGTRARSITYVYEEASVDPNYPPKIDSSVILLSYTGANKIDRIRVTHIGVVIYDFEFVRSNNVLVGIHERFWIGTNPQQVDKSELQIIYDVTGKPKLLKATWPGYPSNTDDSLIVKTANNRIDSVIRPAWSPTFTTKCGYTYNASGDIVRINYGSTELYMYTLSNSPSQISLGDEAIIWYQYMNFFANVSSTTPFMLPPNIFHSTKQPLATYMSNQGIGGTANYQTEYYSTGKPKKMTANVTSGTGVFIGREAYYYSYAQ